MEDVREVSEDRNSIDVAVSRISRSRTRGRDYKISGMYAEMSPLIRTRAARCLLLSSTCVRWVMACFRQTERRPYFCVAAIQ